MIQLFELHKWGEHKRQVIPLLKMQYFNSIGELNAMVKKQSEIFGVPVYPSYRTIPDRIYKMDKLEFSNEVVDSALLLNEIIVFEPLFPQPKYRIYEKYSEIDKLYYRERQTNELYIPTFIQGDELAMSEPYNSKIFPDCSPWKKPEQMPCNLYRATLELILYSVTRLQQYATAFDTGFNSFNDFIKHWNKQNPDTPYESNPYVWKYTFRVNKIKP